ncbi:purple acid phosphatase family protein [Auraticoccus monumenti]|uniref:Purple acid Phosphatase, N-terminal domain n=1 Tax=Auraticoccus monumenti TaxID=675864 RepID=A0A1G7E6I7_9ACTN|nr:metallophosphoesterase family protein [Auraticoccus monumenti]SDE58995.1 Purple acid Phosphatase, N-terminal domain [Auraticoccus monumenti]
MTLSRLSRPLACAAVTGALLLTTLTPTADARDGGFRVNPYLQNPTTTSMTVTWFSYDDAPGELVLDGPGHRGTRLVSDPEPQPVLAYTELERQQEIPGLEQGSWLHEDGNVKHVVRLTGLEPGSTYTYRVTQDGATVGAELSTAPGRRDWEHIRFMAMSDSETEPLGRVQRREWAPGLGAEDRPAATPGGEWDQTFGTTTLSGTRVLRYPLTEDDGYRRNLAVLHAQDPDFVLYPGDLVQGGGYQPGWDEFFRHNAGEVGSGLSSTPVLPALGNWESFGALNGGYGTPEDRSAVVRSRAKYHAYFDSPANGTPAHADNYYRLDYGPVTVITLDPNNGEPDAVPADTPASEKATGREYRGPGTDTQSNFTRAEYEAAGGTDLSDLNPGSTQYTWAERQLQSARRQGQVVVVQFHHSAYSSGEHGLPMYHADTSGQGGTPMRQYHPLFERYGVSAVISGHSEMFERSFVDEDGDGVGVHYYDVGVAGDGLRGERHDGPTLEAPLLRYNEFRRWTADQDEREVWAEVDGVRQLVSGGKHYGHLQVDLTRVSRGRAKAELVLTPVHSFPVLDADRRVVRTERRTYADVVTLELDARGRVLR